MSRSSDSLSAEQSAKFEEAAYLVIKARQQAAAMLEEAGVKLDLDPSPFASKCGARLAPPPPHRFCGCDGYKGDGGPCINLFRDPNAPGFDEGVPLRQCGHRPSDHDIAP
jgi:hypothetical protein